MSLIFQVCKSRGFFLHTGFSSLARLTNVQSSGVIWALRAQSYKWSSKMGSRALQAPGPKKSKTESKKESK